MSLIIIIGIGLGCQQSESIQGIDLKINFQPQPLTDESYVKMDYCLTLSNQFNGLSRDYIMYVWFYLPKENKLLFADHHLPLKRTTAWRSADQFNYSRLVFIPVIDQTISKKKNTMEIVEVRIGLFFPAVKAWEWELCRQKLAIKKAERLTPEIVMDKGWWKKEKNSKDPNPLHREWFWTKQQAGCIIANMRQEMLLTIQGEVSKKAVSNQQVLFKINHQLVDAFIPENSEFSKTYILSAEAVKGKDNFYLTIAADKTFIPQKINLHKKDKRELGMKIYRIRIQASGGIFPKDKKYSFIDGYFN